MSNKIYLFLAILISAGLAGCSDDEPDDPIIPNEEELITTLIYELIEDGGTDTVRFEFRDLDGEGGDAPIVSADTLKANTTYTGSVMFLNEQEDPAEDITEEVEEEADEHQVFYSSSANGVSIVYSAGDVDGNGNPIGLMTDFITTDSTDGMLKITLRHEPDKMANGVSDGDITNAGGQTDIEVDFNVHIR